VGKKEIKDIPILGKLMEWGGTVFVDRADGKSAIKAMEPLVDAIKIEGKSICISPEGTRSLTPKLEPFKKGAFHLAMQAGVLKDKGKPFVMALTNGKFPVEELEKFANGQPSAVDKFAAGVVEPLTLTLVDSAAPGKLQGPAPTDPFALPAAPDGIHDDTGATVDVSKEVDVNAIEATAKDGDDLPVTFCAYASVPAGTGGQVRLWDGSAGVTLTGISTAAWYSVDTTLDVDSIASNKLDLQARDTSGNTISVRGVALWARDA
jgi:hypothetical protein